MKQPILDYVLEELDARKGLRTGNLTDIAKCMQPDSWESYYSWLTKLAQRKIPDPGVRNIQQLHDFFRAENKRRGRVAA